MTTIQPPNDKERSTLCLWMAGEVLGRSCQFSGSPHQSCPWVGLTCRSGCVGSIFSAVCWVRLGRGSEFFFCDGPVQSVGLIALGWVKENVPTNVSDPDNCGHAKSPLYLRRTCQSQPDIDHGLRLAQRMTRGI